MSEEDAGSTGNWFDVLPRKIYASLEKVETSQPWYDVYRIHDWLYALYEGGQYDEALMYLVIGYERAVVIDGGTGIGHLDKLVEELTDKPYFLLLTHTHNDHIGGCKDFTEIALYDDVMSWESAAKGLGKDKMGEIIEEGYVIRDYPEDFDPDNYYAPPYLVTQWLQDGDRVDLGGRTLEIVYTPGHSSNHISLLDREGRYLYTGDIFYTGGVTSYLPGRDHDDFITSCRKLVDLMPHYDLLMPAHNEPLVEKELMKEMLKVAKDIKAGKLKNYKESRSIAVNYDIKVRRYQFDRFVLTTRADL
ncbi:MAG: MBL fold metallo-hydrolase [Candidatus Bathyarchaeota archaeon]|nr:MBL fold metallo-hydrolase [Candidatus Bathyarchaeota archaeon]